MSLFGLLVLSCLRWVTFWNKKENNNWILFFMKLYHWILIDLLIAKWILEVCHTQNITNKIKDKHCYLSIVNFRNIGCLIICKRNKRRNELHINFITEGSHIHAWLQHFESFSHTVLESTSGPISLTLLFAIFVKSVTNLKWSLKGLTIICGFR